MTDTTKHNEKIYGVFDLIRVISRLAEIEAAASAAIPVGWELPEALAVDFSDLALDILGVPQDQTLESATGFCRDWFYEKWNNVVYGDLPVVWFITEVKFVVGWDRDTGGHCEALRERELL